MAKPTLVFTKKSNPTMVLTPIPTLQITPKASVPYKEASYTAMNQNTESPVLFRDLTA